MKAQENKISLTVQRVFSIVFNQGQRLTIHPLRKHHLLILVLFVFAANSSYQYHHNDTPFIENQNFIAHFQSGLKHTYDASGDSIGTQPQLNTSSLQKSVRLFYAFQEYRPVFTEYNGLSEEGLTLITLLEQSRFYGLEPEQYHTERIRELQTLLQNPELEQERLVVREELETNLANDAMLFMFHLHSGYNQTDSAFSSDPFAQSLPVRLAKAFSRGHFKENVLGCQPRFIEYQRLQQATEKFIQQVELTDSWTDLNVLKEDSTLLWNGIHEVLVKLGYMSKDDSSANTEEGLKVFQKFHGLESDGKPGANTIEALSQSTLHKYRILALNLDRLRKQQQLESHVLFVNIPAYNLKVIKNNRIEDTYRVCVGRTYSQTPRIDGNIEQIVINPEWNVPARIARREILPKIQSDAGYLKKNRFTVFDENMQVVNDAEVNWASVSSDSFNYFIQQDPSSGNSLGRVKFLFDNNYSVYLHDTPSKSLFAKDIRAFSHGCVRVQDSEGLAAYLVEQLQTESLDVEDIISSGHRYEINLDKSIPVKIKYLTCSGDEQGNLYYYKDIYGLDQKEIEDFM